jgi:hypothetical protein
MPESVRQYLPVAAGFAGATVWAMVLGHLIIAGLLLTAAVAAWRPALVFHNQSLEVTGPLKRRIISWTEIRQIQFSEPNGFSRYLVLELTDGGFLRLEVGAIWGPTRKRLHQLVASAPRNEENGNAIAPTKPGLGISRRTVATWSAAGLVVGAATLLVMAWLPLPPGPLRTVAVAMLGGLLIASVVALVGGALILIAPRTSPKH